jgi:hypothetical protein
MNMEKTDHNINHDPVQLMARVMTYLPLILLKSGTAWLSFKRQAKKGSNAFYKELLRQGLDKQTAKLFAQQYVEGSNIMKTVFNRSSIFSFPYSTTL